ncbi:MAG: peroxidase-related enzyme [Phycisphaerales bacterium]|nr:peroxidase-related enzyme [Phycisphaerales bacterium]
MSRIKPLEVENAPDKAKTLLGNVQKALGMTPNLMRTLAHSPAALEALLSFNKALGGGSLKPSLREQIALTVSNLNTCDYCVAAHTALGKKFGLGDTELADSLKARSNDPKTEAALMFAGNVVERNGHVDDEHFQAVRGAGFSDGEIAEIIATVAITTFTNYFNDVARVEIDFPPVAALETAKS